jgi:hypothetical protein
MSDEWYVCLRKYDWGAIARSTTLVAPGPTGAAYGLSLLTAMLSDALEFQVDRHVILFNNVREWTSSGVSTVTQNVSPEDRRVQMDMMLALVPGAAIGSKLAQVLQPLALDIEEFAQQLVAGGSNWVEEAFSYLREKANTAGSTVGSFIVKLGSAFLEAALDGGMTTARVQSYLDNVIVPTILDTANGIANAVSEFTQDIPNTLFNLGRTINTLADIQLIDQAYAGELSDPRLASSVRAAAEQARDIVQQAGQIVVIQQGLGRNPFETAGFDPAAVPPLALNLNEGQQQTLTIYLPYEAGIGGQKLTLSLNGVNASGFMIRAGGLELSPEGNVFTLTVLEGQKQLVIALRQTQDIGAASALSLVAQLVNAAGAATHRHDEEATIALADNGDLIDGSAPTIDYENGLPTSTIVGGDEDNVETLLGAQNYIYHGNGDPWARGYREVDGPQHISCSNCLVVPAQQSP